MDEAKARKLRLRDFERRKQSDPSAVSYVTEYGWEYINVHPMADEVEVLQRLSIQPEDCVAVDCYWFVGYDVFFLQVYSKSFLQGRVQGLYAQWWTKNVPRLNLAAYLDESYISRRQVEEVMLKFHLLGLQSERFSSRQLTERLTLVSK